MECIGLYVCCLLIPYIIVGSQINLSLYARFPSLSVETVSDVLRPSDPLPTNGVARLDELDTIRLVEAFGQKLMVRTVEGE
jgi:hypothetical protein